jgi:hypothetical protein|tara:strand:+ start:2123 stop:2482 length:360 start_codon:yes stop_codon:yes gene_type:complete
MKYFAKLDLNSKVIGITHVVDNDAPTEEAGIEYLNKLHSHSSWKECSKHNDNFRKNAASIGMTYDEDKDAFLWLENNSAWESSVFNEDTCRWEHPIPHPNDHKIYHWEEETTSWVEGVI